MIEPGPLRFDEFMELALYDPVHGFFAGASGSGGEAGRARGDFITSPEVGPLFGLLVGRFLDRCWDRAGRPERFDVVEYAAGRGALAISIRSAAPECSGALRYHLVERSERLRERQREHLPVVMVGDRPLPSQNQAEMAADLPVAPPVETAGTYAAADPDSQPDAPAGASLFFSHADDSTLPQEADVVLANELLDNLPFRLFERAASGWSEVMVTAPAGADGGLGGDQVTSRSGTTSTDVLADGHPGLPAPPDDAVAEHWTRPGIWTERLALSDDRIARLLDSLAPDAPAGARVPLQQRAGEWLANALRLVGVASITTMTTVTSASSGSDTRPGAPAGASTVALSDMENPDAPAGTPNPVRTRQRARTGTVLVIDYSRGTPEMAALHQNDWLRTYRAHERGTSPLETPGSQDITCDVAVDQLDSVRATSTNTSQSDWLVDLGIDELVAEGRRIWADNAAAPDLAAFKARSRATEAEALCDPTGLGGFRVLIWQ